MSAASASVGYVTWEDRYPADRLVPYDPGWAESYRVIAMSSTGFDGGFELPLSRLLGEGGAVSGLVLDRSARQQIR